MIWKRPSSRRLPPGSYTVILRGMGMTSGVGLVEIYDLNPGVDSKLANLSTRAFIDTGNNIVIAGFILGGSGNDRIVARGIGPSLTALGVPNALPNPTLELRDGNGALLIANDDWQDDQAQAAELTAAGLAPSNDLESGIAATLPRAFTRRCLPERTTAPASAWSKSTISGRRLSALAAAGAYSEVSPTEPPKDLCLRGLSITRTPMQIHVARNGQQLGQYSVEEVNRQLADGTLLPTDLGWHEGSAGWAPLSSIAGLTMPAAAASPAMPISPPPAPPAPPIAPSPRPVTAQSSVTAATRQPVQNSKGLVVTSWILLGVTFLISLVPVLGCGSWLLAWPVAVATLIMAILILTRGEKTQGIAILIASILIVPLTMVASIASTALLGASVSEHEKPQEKQIIENLRALSDAKAKWVAQTKVKEGAKVTVAGLSAYLEGREIKSIVGEIYDPRPVGEEPTATLPATKSLASHPKGAVLTASGSSLALDTSSSSSSEREDDPPSPAASPEQL